MVADHVFHLPMRQHAGLRPPGRAGGIEEPRRMVVRDVGGSRHRRPVRRQRIPFQHPRPDGNLQLASGIFRLRGRRMVGERGSRKCAPRRPTMTRDTPPRAGSGENSSAPRPRRASTMRTSSPARRSNCGRAAARGRHAARRVPPSAPPPPGRGATNAPKSRSVAPDQRRAIGKAPRRLQQQMREVAGRDQRKGSRIET